MANCTLIVGGIRSGKSRLAEQLAMVHPPVVYLATAHAGDAEMVNRIAAHRRRRPTQWETVEESWEVETALSSRPGAGCILLECLTLWLTNLVVGLPGKPGLDDEAIFSRMDGLIMASGKVSAEVIIVSNEIGLGLVPANPLARRFADLLGEANQKIAAGAASVYGCVAGIPHRLK